MMHSRTLHFLRAAAALAAITIAVSAYAAPAKRGSEIRALWVSRFDWNCTNPSEIATVMRNAASHNFNTVLFQVRGEAAVFWPSKIEPWAGNLTGSPARDCGKDPGWDPLGEAIRQAHANGLELHAWTNVMPGWQQKTNPPASCNPPHVRVAHPDWFMYDGSGKPMSVANIYACLNPAHPEVQRHLQDLYQELATNYPDLDGIHLDYIRFPGEYRNGPYTGSELSTDPVSLKLFKNQYGATPKSAPQQWAQFRVEQVTNLVNRIAAVAKQCNPRLVVSASVNPNYGDAENRQDSLGWLNAGYVDWIAPMNYTPKRDLFQKRTSTFVQGARQGGVVMGLWAKYGLEAFRSEVQHIRTTGAEGVAVYCYSDLFPGHRPNEYARALKKSLFAEPAQRLKPTVAGTAPKKTAAVGRGGRRTPPAPGEWDEAPNPDVPPSHMGGRVSSPGRIPPALPSREETKGKPIPISKQTPAVAPELSEQAPDDQLAAESAAPVDASNNKPRILRVEGGKKGADGVATLRNDDFRIKVSADDPDGDRIVEYRLRAANYVVSNPDRKIRASMPAVEGLVEFEFVVVDERGASSDPVKRQFRLVPPGM